MTRPDPGAFSIPVLLFPKPEVGYSVSKFRFFDLTLIPASLLQEPTLSSNSY